MLLLENDQDLRPLDKKRVLTLANEYKMDNFSLFSQPVAIELVGITKQEFLRMKKPQVYAV